MGFPNGARIRLRFMAVIRWGFKLILARWSSQPMRKRLRERQQITARPRSISLIKHSLSFRFVAESELKASRKSF